MHGPQQIYFAITPFSFCSSLCPLPSPLRENLFRRLVLSLNFPWFFIAGLGWMTSPLTAVFSLLTEYTHLGSKLPF